MTQQECATETRGTHLGGPRETRIARAGRWTATASGDLGVAGVHRDLLELVPGDGCRSVTTASHLTTPGNRDPGRRPRAPRAPAARPGRPPARKHDRMSGGRPGRDGGGPGATPLARVPHQTERRSLGGRPAPRVETGRGGDGGPEGGGPLVDQPQQRGSAQGPFPLRLSPAAHRHPDAGFPTAPPTHRDGRRSGGARAIRRVGRSPGSPRSSSAGRAPPVQRGSRGGSEIGGGAARSRRPAVPSAGGRAPGDALRLVTSHSAAAASKEPVAARVSRRA